MLSATIRVRSEGVEGESEDEGDFHFHTLSFSIFLTFDICIIFLFDIFTFDQSQKNHRSRSRSSAGPGGSVLSQIGFGPPSEFTIFAPYTMRFPPKKMASPPWKQFRLLEFIRIKFKIILEYSCFGVFGRFLVSCLKFCFDSYHL